MHDTEWHQDFDAALALMTFLFATFFWIKRTAMAMAAR